jgi:hypothetical protein
VITLPHTLYPKLVFAYKFIIQLIDINIVYLVLPLQKGMSVPVCSLKPFQGAGCVFQTYQRCHLIVVLFKHFHQHVLVRLDFSTLKNGFNILRSNLVAMMN